MQQQHDMYDWDVYPKRCKILRYVLFSMKFKLGIFYKYVFKSLNKNYFLKNTYHGYST